VEGVDRVGCSFGYITWVRLTRDFSEQSAQSSLPFLNHIILSIPFLPFVIPSVTKGLLLRLFPFFTNLQVWPNLVNGLNGR
jgi:hypothetical protein